MNQRQKFSSYAIILISNHLFKLKMPIPSIIGLIPVKEKKACAYRSLWTFIHEISPISEKKTPINVMYACCQFLILFPCEGFER